MAIGNDGHTWLVSTDGVPYIRTPTGSWQEKPKPSNRDCIDISVGNSGHIWSINNEKRIFKWIGNSWQEVSPGLQGQKISVGKDGTVWHLKPVSGEVWVKNATNNNWSKITTAVPSICNCDHKPQQECYPEIDQGKAKEIFVHDADHIWAIGKNDKTYKYVLNRGWQKLYAYGQPSR